MDAIIKQFRDKHWDKIKKKKNVNSYSGQLKPRISDGKEVPGSRVIRVYVSKKEPLSSLSLKDALPDTISLSQKDIEIDVVEIGPINAWDECGRPRNSLDSLSTIPEQERHRPLLAGISWMNENVLGACTLGWFAKNKKEGEEEFIGIVVNNHCGARENKGVKGEKGLQPSPMDQGSKNTDRVSSHWRHIELKYTGFVCPLRDFLHSIFRGTVALNTLTNYTDSSFERLLDDISYVPEFYGIGGVTGKEDFKVNELVEKVGRTTGHTKDGKVIDLSWNGDVRYSRGTCYFEDMVLIVGNKFSQGGDSSSFIRSMETRKLKGKLFAGSNTHTIAIPQSRIENLLKVELIV